MNGIIEEEELEDEGSDDEEYEANWYPLGDLVFNYYEKCIHSSSLNFKYE